MSILSLHHITMVSGSARGRDRIAGSLQPVVATPWVSSNGNGAPPTFDEQGMTAEAAATAAG